MLKFDPTDPGLSNGEMTSEEAMRLIKDL